MNALNYLTTSLFLALGAIAQLEAQSANPPGRLYFGWATTSITPDRPVTLCGQYHRRIGDRVHDPVQATALAIETRKGTTSIDQAVWVSCDLVAIRGSIQERLRARVRDQIPGLNVQKIFLSATHTHTAPVLTDPQETDLHPHDFLGSWTYRIPPERTDVMRPSEYTEFLVDRLAKAVIEAWGLRQPGGLSSALSHAVIGLNRRAVYTDGTTRMYGGTHEANFSHIEGVSDPSVDLLFFWRDERLDGLAINIYCPSQEVEGENYISADFWYDTRALLRERYSTNLNILSLCGAAGDQSPHVMWNKNAETRMRERQDHSTRQEIADRLVRAVDNAVDRARAQVKTEVLLTHRVETVPLPVRTVSEERFAQARARFEAGRNRTDQLNDREYIEWRVSRTIMGRYALQKEDPFYRPELHFLRLDDLAIATNPFELYTDYGVRIKARSPAAQTLVVQLTADCAAYLPTKRAVAGGGYSARIVDGVVGPEGGAVLVNESSKLLDEMWQRP